MRYYNQYLNLKQAPYQSIDDYTSKFLELRMKVNQNNATPIEHVILKFV